MSTSEIATVLAWHDALNTADLDTLVALSSDDIEIGDADGAAQGHAALRDWAQRSTATIEVGQIYYHDGVVVVEERLTRRPSRVRSARRRRRSGWSATTSPRCSATTTWPPPWPPPN